MAQDIAALVDRLVEIPARLRHVVLSYLLALMIDADKHSLRLAGEIGGRHPSQFSRLLQHHGELAEAALTQASQGIARELAPQRAPLVPGVPWTVAIIVDAMLHERSSPKLEGAKTLSAGRGFIVGHQWTNIVLVVADRVIPLPPIPFLTKKECRRRGIKYQTANERLREYLEGLELSRWIGTYRLEEIVFMADSGYDDKKLKRLILDHGWDFVIGVHSTRTCKSSKSDQYRKIDALFRATRKQAPWKTVRFEIDDGKRRAKYRARKLTGFLRGVPREVALVCSEKATRKGRRYLACSRVGLDVGVILRAYRTRWRIELFHRAVKGQLGATDVAASSFASVTAHVHWVYCAYALMVHAGGISGDSLIDRQRRLGREVRAAPLKAAFRKVIAARTQFGGQSRAKELAAAAIEHYVAGKAAS